MAFVELYEFDAFDEQSSTCCDMPAVQSAPSQRPQRTPNGHRSNMRSVARALVSHSGRLPFDIDTIANILDEVGVPYELVGNEDAISLARTLGFRFTTPHASARSKVVLNLDTVPRTSLRKGEWVLYPKNSRKKIDTCFRMVDGEEDGGKEGKKQAIVYTAVVEAGASWTLGERTVVVFASKYMRIAIRYALIASGFENVSVVGVTALSGLLACPKRGHPPISIICDSRTITAATYFGNCAARRNIRLTVIA
jgi:hypothetical protein